MTRAPMPMKRIFRPLRSSTPVISRRNQPPDSGGSTVQTTGLMLKRAKLASIRSEEHTSELQSLMRITYAVFCLKKKNRIKQMIHDTLDRPCQTHAIWFNARVHISSDDPVGKSVG